MIDSPTAVGGIWTFVKAGVAGVLYTSIQLYSRVPHRGIWVGRNTEGICLSFGRG